MRVTYICRRYGARLWRMSASESEAVFVIWGRTQCLQRSQQRGFRRCRGRFLTRPQRRCTGHKNRDGCSSGSVGSTSTSRI